jgi:hypothetical protein
MHYATTCYFIYMESSLIPHTLIARIAPQRATQYADMAETLALPELEVSPLGAMLTEAATVSLAGQPYIKMTVDASLPPLPIFATLSEWFDYFDRIGDTDGPLLRPISVEEPLRFTPDLVEARRYKGKTNELLTHFLVNIARWTHGNQPRILFDPMAGGGTLAFTALRFGFSVLGVERDKEAVAGTDTFLRTYFQQERIKHSRMQEKRKAGHRFRFALPQEQSITIAQGETRDTSSLLSDLPGTPRPDLVVGDLPYSIQHNARYPLPAILSDALPVWHDVAAPGAVLALAWNATTLKREQMLELVAKGGWSPVVGGAYDRMAHQVDRVIKVRDVVVARK